MCIVMVHSTNQRPASSTHVSVIDCDAVGLGTLSLARVIVEAGIRARLAQS
jgi:hypothetical protein